MRALARVNPSITILTSCPVTAHTRGVDEYITVVFNHKAIEYRVHPDLTIEYLEG